MAGRPLTEEERMAAEAAFKGYACEPGWSASAHRIYDGIIRALLARAPRKAGVPCEQENSRAISPRTRRNGGLIRRATS